MEIQGIMYVNSSEYGKIRGYEVSFLLFITFSTENNYVLGSRALSDSNDFSQALIKKIFLTLC